MCPRGRPLGSQRQIPTLSLRHPGRAPCADFRRDIVWQGIVSRPHRISLQLALVDALKFKLALSCEVERLAFDVR